VVAGREAPVAPQCAVLQGSKQELSEKTEGIGGMNELKTHKNLKAYLQRYYRHRGKVKSITPAKNLSGKPWFADVKFVDGSVATFCARDDGTWYRNEGTLRVKAKRMSKPLVIA
jgi:hypothetical protein